MSVLIAIFFLVTGFALGSLGATIAHLSKEIEEAKNDGHRR